jgi:hypothetical protein
VICLLAALLVLPGLDAGFGIDIRSLEKPRVLAAAEKFLKEKPITSPTSPSGPILPM